MERERGGKKDKIQKSELEFSFLRNVAFHALNKQQQHSIPAFVAQPVQQYIHKCTIAALSVSAAL